MARKPIRQKTSASLSVDRIRAAIPKVRRRLEELSLLDLNTLSDQTGGHVLDSYVQKINATMRDIYGIDSVEYEEYSVDTFQPMFSIYYEGMDTSIRGNMDTVRGKAGSAITKLKTLIEIYEEQVGETPVDAINRTIQAYSGLDLHPEIARAASSLYTSGHYANAVEVAVKALNNLVRLRSGLEFDGTTLMERAFNPTSPALKFNNLQDQSDKDEQKGFMQMFSGAVSGLRNPRAHRFVHDDPERALEFIAFISLLAKLSDEATPSN